MRWIPVCSKRYFCYLPYLLDRGQFNPRSIIYLHERSIGFSAIVLSCSFRFFLTLYAWLFIMFALAAFSEDARLLAGTLKAA